jgi:hypothetical protein
MHMVAAAIDEQPEAVTNRHREMQINAALQGLSLAAALEMLAWCRATVIEFHNEKGT